MNVFSRAAGYALRHGRIAHDAALPSAFRVRKRQRALAQLEHVTFATLTFVCQGNINRSAVAEHRLRASPKACNLSVHSCGLHLRGGRPSPPLSIAVAGELGVDLGSHRSLRAADINARGTLLVGFEPHHLLAWSAGPSRESKAILLGVFDPDERAPMLIPDPYGSESDFVRSVFQRVILCVDAMASRLEHVGESKWRLNT